MKAYAVIGANYGDEGKGLTTDYLASKSQKPLVVRFNGGAQAGHTVVTPKGDRHSFHHFGSGTLAGADTFLSDKFIINPYIFSIELREIQDLTGHTPTVFVHEDCLVTTPYDMIANRFIEKSRGDNRHGSCGAGIHETIRRDESGTTLRAKELRDWPTLRAKIKAIKNYMKEMVPCEFHDDPLFQLILSDSVEAHWIGDVNNFLAITMMAPSLRKVWEFCRSRNIIFEGAQGLLLDENHKFFPYVTHSSTGMTNVLPMIESIPDINEIEVIYVTRCYITRHGAGPLPNEVPEIPGIDFVDTTNTENEFQGKIRLAPFFPSGETMEAVLKDIEKVRTSFARGNGSVEFTAMITCMDQMKDKQIRRQFFEDFTRSFHKSFGGPMGNLRFSFGPTREDVCSDLAAYLAL
jgi:adenylosuccinate synthase